WVWFWWSVDGTAPPNRCWRRATRSTYGRTARMTPVHRQWAVSSRQPVRQLVERRRSAIADFLVGEGYLLQISSWSDRGDAYVLKPHDMVRCARSADRKHHFGDHFPPCRR